MFPKRPPINFKALVAMFVVSAIIFVLVTSVTQAQLGYFHNSPQRRVENALFRVNHAGELRLMRLLFNRGYELYGYYARGPHGPRTFYPVLDRNCKPLGKRQRWERGIGLTLAGAVIGGIVDGWKGAGKGAAAGGAGALINDSRYCNPEQKQEEIYYPSDPLPERGGASRRPTGGVFSTRPLAGPAADSREGEFELSNATRFLVEVYDGNEYLGRMKPGEVWHVDAPLNQYDGYALIPNKRGKLSKDTVDRDVSDRGWVFTEPTFPKGGK